MEINWMSIRIYLDWQIWKNSRCNTINTIIIVDIEFILCIFFSTKVLVLLWSTAVDQATNWTNLFHDSSIRLLRCRRWRKFSIFPLDRLNCRKQANCFIRIEQNCLFFTHSLTLTHSCCCCLALIAFCKFLSRSHATSIRLNCIFYRDVFMFFFDLLFIFNI